MEEKKGIEILAGAILILFLLIVILLVLEFAKFDGDYKEREYYSNYKTVITKYATHVEGDYANYLSPYYSSSWSSYEKFFEEEYGAVKQVTIIEEEKYFLEKYKD